MATVRGGDKIKAALQMLTDKIKPATVRVGFLKGSTYPDGESVASIAAYNEYGVLSRGQPPRPFFRNMIAAKKKNWPEAISKTLKSNNYDVERSLGIVGEAISGQLKQSITDLKSPPLRPSTIAAKGFSKPLIDTGHMLASVDYEVTT